jgi:hypothetical protein
MFFARLHPPGRRLARQSRRPPSLLPLPLAGAALPAGLITTTTPNGAATETFTGNPTQVGTFTFLVTVMDSEPGIPPVTASTTFTIVVNQDPTVKRLP